MSATGEYLGDPLVGPMWTEGPALARELAGRIGINALTGHLAEFQRIADRNGGRRASGTPGHEESAGYVADRLDAAGFQVSVQEFPISYAETLAERLVVDGEELDVTVMRHSPNTPAGGISGELAVLPAGARGCEPSDFVGGDYAGKIVLIERGGCPHARKQQHAAAAGAIGSLIYNNNDEWLLGTLVSADQGRIPTGGISRELGARLTARAGAWVTLELHMSSEDRLSRNVIAQTRSGRPDNVVMAGAHLDSVVEGPGINDAATGSAALLETALRLGGSPRVANAVRFAWWGAEEFGQIGSNHYIDSLSAEQRLDIAMYLNVDMLGSPNGGHFVFRAEDRMPSACVEIERSFRDCLGFLGVPTEPVSLVGGFDHMPFIEVGIPAGGLYTGATAIKTPAQARKWGGRAGVPYDPNYHRAADDLSNVDRTALIRNAVAFAWVTACYAISTDGANGVPNRPARAAGHLSSAH